MPVKTGIQEFSKGFLFGLSWIPDQFENDKNFWTPRWARNDEMLVMLTKQPKGVVGYVVTAIGAVGGVGVEKSLPNR